jgi:hypothetical protein
MIRVAPSPQSVATEPVKVFEATAATKESSKAAPALKLPAEPSTANRPKAVKPRVTKKKPTLAEESSQLDLEG